MLAPLVVGGEASRVCRLGDLALEDLLEGVGALARGRVDVAHQMHFRDLLYVNRYFGADRVGCGRHELTCARGLVIGLWFCGDGVLFPSTRAKLLLVQIFEKLGCLVEPGSALAPQVAGQ